MKPQNIIVHFLYQPPPENIKLNEKHIQRIISSNFFECFFGGGIKLSLTITQLIVFKFF